MPIEIPYSLLVRDGDVAWTCGQVPLEGDSRVVAPDDLVAPTRVVSDHIEEILRLGALPNAAIGKLVLYCVSRWDSDKKRMIEAFRARGVAYIETFMVTENGLEVMSKLPRTLVVV